MYNLTESLLACGYTGPCEDPLLLAWAIRAGASSQFFNDLVYWLESQLNLVVSTHQARDNIRRLFSMLRQSILMKPSYGSDSAINPKEFRLHALKVLAQQLELRKLPNEQMHRRLNHETLQKDHDNAKHSYKSLTITLNMNKKTYSGDWNQRLVRYNASN